MLLFYHSKHPLLSSYKIIYASINIHNYPDDWSYEFIPSETLNVTSGSTQTVNFGGPLTTTITTNKSTYSPGETVNIKVKVTDAYNHPLDRMYYYNYSSSSGNSLIKEPSGNLNPNINR